VLEAGRRAVAICHCRHVEHHLGRDCQKFRVECCLSLGGGADYVIRHGLGKPVERNQALELLAETRSAGLVHIADNVRSRPTFICNCCGCCCEILQGFQRLRLFQHTLTSNFIARPSAERCTGCKKCQQACPIGALHMEEKPHQVEGKSYRFLARVDESVCLGCGVCALACKYGSMKLRPRKQKRIPPENTFTRVMTMALEQGKFHHLLAEAFDSWSGQLGAAFLGAIVRLPPASLLLARRELRSRFVDWTLKRLSARRFPEKQI
jgi:formate hydrogenlyase subunit 6/NADH:ubiquinone oxidoreductase subunit I